MAQPNKKIKNKTGATCKKNPPPKKKEEEKNKTRMLRKHNTCKLRWLTAKTNIAFISRNSSVQNKRGPLLYLHITHI